MKNPALQPYLWILISGFVFSWMATCAPLAGRACGWQVVAIVRCAIPLLLIAIWTRWDGVKLVVWGPPILWVRSIAGSCSLVGTFFCFHILPLTDIYTIANTFPIWVALLSWPMFGKIPSLSVWISIACSIAGVVFIQGPDLQSGNYAALVVVAVSIFTAVAMMGLNRLQDLDPRAIVVHFSATALIFAIASLFLFPWTPPTETFELKHLFELLGVGVTATFGQFFLTKAFTAGDPAKMSVASLSQFVYIPVLDALVLEHPFVVSKLWGIPLILGPTVWLMLHRVKPETATSSPIVADSSEVEPDIETVPALSCDAKSC